MTQLKLLARPAVHRLVLRAFGVALLLLGLAALYIGPIEISVYYAFVEGGRFHYPGFGFGSFMFANIAVQIAGYYLIAGLCIPLGIGHLKLRSWARKLTLTLLWTWLIIGLPLVPVLLFMLFTAKVVSVAMAIVVIVVTGLSYLLFPGLLLAFYHSSAIRVAFGTQEPPTHWLNQKPLPILVLWAVQLCYLFALHVLLLLNGIVPVFGAWWSGKQGTSLIAGLAVCQFLLIWGTFKQRMWAWWGLLFYTTALALSSLLTLGTSSWHEILALLNLPAFEMEKLGGMPLDGIHFALAIGIPLIATIGLILYARRDMPRGREGWWPIL